MAAELILFVDDEPSIRKLVGVFLTRRGYRVKVATDGLDALRLFAEEVPQLLITDLNMPNLDGRLLLKRLRAENMLGNTATMVLSASAGINDPVPLEVDDYLVKPVTMAELALRVAAALSAARSRGEAHNRRNVA